MSLPTLPPLRHDYLFFIYVSGTEPTYFTAPCPYCVMKMKVEIDPTGGCTNVPVNFLISRCPFCELLIAITIKPNERSSLLLELIIPSLYRLRLAAPEEDIRRPYLPSQLSRAEQPSHAPRYNAYLEIIKQRGYLTAEEYFSYRGQRWNGNLYWERYCP
jgi:hypothetical protein